MTKPNTSQNLKESDYLGDWNTALKHIPMEYVIQGYGFDPSV